MAQTATVMIPANNEAGFVVVEADSDGNPIGDISKWKTTYTEADAVAQNAERPVLSSDEVIKEKVVANPRGRGKPVRE